MHPTIRGSRGVRLAWLVAGLFVFALGLALIVRSHMGLGPWDVFHQGVARHTPLSFGSAIVVVGLIVLLAAWWMGAPPGLGTLLNAVLVGVFVDLLLRSHVPATPDAWAGRALMDVTGIALVAVGSALYIGAHWGAGPRDSAMLALSHRTGWRIGVARATLEVSACTAGLALGGTAGLGTLLFAFGVGPAVEAAFWVLARSPLATAPRGRLASAES